MSICRIIFSKWYKLEGKLEGKLEAVPFMLSLGATVEQIAEALKLDIESVRQVAESTKTIQEKSSQSDTAK
ncbi:hypothetical protein [Fischerella sp.]|uniref:hypothetical protein n=1 Tax=Fischerella sp. TaxID=1191 RepID=UPI0025BF89FE|nr:hypothetical protein [Fischerella sp.]